MRGFIININNMYVKVNGVIVIIVDLWLYSAYNLVSITKFNSNYYYSLKKNNKHKI